MHILILLVISCALLTSCTVQAREGAPPQYSMKTVSYVPSLRDNAHAMDIYVPANAKKPMPAILWIHGGAWKMGSKEDTPAPFFMKSGFLVASINYRFSNKAIFPAQLEDAKAAVRWLRDHAKEYNIDPNRIAAFGNSAGGHLSALLGTTGDITALEGKFGNLKQSSKVQAVVDWCGPSDFLTIAEQGGPRNRLQLNNPDGPVAQLLGGLPNKKREMAAAASPVTYISEKDPPFLIMHGDNDTVVPIEQSLNLYQVLKAARVPVEYRVVKNGEHNFCTAENLQIVDDFLKKTLH